MSNSADIRHLRQRQRRRAQMRYRLGQLANAAIYLIVTIAAATVLLSL